MALRKGQKELVEQYRGGYCAVPAIPGGGKTHCLSLWAAEIISAGLHKPGRILIVTYMNSAVNNFKQRISGELQKRGITGSKDYFVSTIHGLCMQIIKEKPDLANASEEFEVVDGISKLYLLSSSVEDWRRDNEERFRTFMDESQLNSPRVQRTCKDWHDRLCGIVSGSIGDFKCRGINPSEALEKCSQLPDDSILRCSAEIYDIYDKRLKMAGFLDFDDMLYNARKLLEQDESLLDKYRKRYTFVCEDEAQDSNLIQSEILSLISNGNLLRVGDSNQAICGSFTNSDYTLFKNFCEMPETTVYKITQSSRNSRDIIDFANYFTKYIRENHPVQECMDSLVPQFIEPVGVEDERQNPVTMEYGIKAGIFKSWEEEANAVVTQAYHMLKKHPDKTMAILVPSSWKIEFIVSLMEARNMSYEELDNASGQRNRTTRLLGRVIDFLSIPESGEKLLSMMNECFMLKDGDETGREKQVLASFLGKYPVEKLLYPPEGKIDICDIPEEVLNLGLWKDFVNNLEKVRELLEFPLIPLEKLVLYIAEKLNFSREERAIAQKVAGDARYLMIHDPSWKLSDLAAELLSTKNMFSYFSGVVWDLKGYEPEPGTVTVSTYHKSKGLEWDIVFLTGLNNADFPVGLNDRFIGEYWFLKEIYKNPQALAKSEMQKIMSGKLAQNSILESKIETISEKARLLYVGITRAKEYLFLSGFHSNPGKRNEIQPSRYILELKKYIDERSRMRD